MKYYRDIKNSIDIARDEGMEKGIQERRKEGLKEGHEKGLKEGHEKGIKKGREDEKIQPVMNGLNKGQHIETIAECTDLSITKSKEISKKLKKE